LGAVHPHTGAVARAVVGVGEVCEPSIQQEVKALLRPGQLLCITHK
jgi:hypothetical protein